jgi:hypothetical protein
MRPLHQWTTNPARDNVTVAFSRTTNVATVDAVAAAGTAARPSTNSRSPTSDQDVASVIAAASNSSSSSRTRRCAQPGARTRTCVGLNYKIPARHAVLSRGRTVLRPVRRRCTRPIPLAARVPAPANPLPLRRYTQSPYSTFPVFSPTRADFSAKQQQYRKCNQPKFLLLFIGKKFKSS